MAVIITVGTYTIDASGTTSTTTGVKLRPQSDESLTDSPEPLFRWSKSTEAASITFWAYVSAADLATLKLAIDALSDAITSPNGDVTLADSSSIVTFSTGSGAYTNATGAVEVHLGELAAFVKCSISFVSSGQSGIPPESGSDEPIEGLVGFVNVDANRNISNRLSMTIEAKFKDTGSVSGLVIVSVEDDGNGEARFVFSGTPDLSELSVGSTLAVVGGAYAGNHIITIVDDANDKITTLTTFTATSVGTASVTGKTADKNALAFIDLVHDRSGAVSGWAWLPAADELRIVSDVVQFVPKAQASTGEEKAGEATARISLSETPNDMTALAAIFRDQSSLMQLVPQGIDQRSGQLFLLTANIQGTLFARVEGNTTFDALQAAASNPTTAQINTAIDLIIATQLSRAGQTGTITETQRDVHPRTESGTIDFQVIGYIGSPTVISWSESINWGFASSDSIIGDIEGNEFVFSQSNRGVFTVSHNLQVAGLDSTPGYSSPPGIDSDFNLVGATMSDPLVTGLGNGKNIITRAFSSDWRYISKGGTPTNGKIQQLMSLSGNSTPNGSVNTQLGFGSGGFIGGPSFAGGIGNFTNFAGF